MVKERLTTKSAQRKKLSTAAQGSRRSVNVNTHSPAALDPRKVKTSFPVPTCGRCSLIISDKVRALQCDRCQSEQWKCADCLCLTTVVYEQVTTDPVRCLRWFCEDCDKLVMDTSSSAGQEGVKGGDKI